jgi:hypothetical protein
MSDLSKHGLFHFLDTVVRQGLVNANTGAGWRAACLKMLGDIDDNANVDQIVPSEAVRRYSNRNPGELKPSSLKEYERRLGLVLRHFLEWTENPAGYKGAGKESSPRVGSGEKLKNKNKDAQKKQAQDEGLIKTVVNEAESGKSAIRTQMIVHQFPLRPGLNSQVTLPTDLKTGEAARLAAFISALVTEIASPEERRTTTS